ncbi:hypothetical protein [uncultured Rikenella sp.]|uniref:hypothetical protein n=1 Tax=uncultured Rikenella sp. TaxID=368003 RepID=UPI002635C4C4|nr:hypothetical protein [uncultured Rikenella sp.]
MPDGPAPGYRGGNDGGLWSISDGGYSWSSAVSDIYSLGLNFHALYLSSNDICGRGYGLPLRCLSE